MKKLLIMLTVVAIFSLGVYGQLLAAKYSVGVFLDARVGGYIVGGGSAFARYETEVVTDENGKTRLTTTRTPGKAIGTEADKIDDSEITFSAKLENVTAQVVFERQNTTNAVLKFDSAYVEVNNLFGLILIRFYDWDFRAGKSGNEDHYILADLSFQGFYTTVTPIKGLTFAIGFGVNADSIRGIHMNIIVRRYIHTDFILGFVVNSSDNKGGLVKEGTLERFQIGFESHFYKDYFNLGVGMIPVGTVLRYYKTRVEELPSGDPDVPGTRRYTISEKSVRDHISYAIAFHGNLKFLDDTVGLSYGIQYVPDTITKLLAAGRRPFAQGTLTNNATGKTTDNPNVIANGSGVRDVYPSNHSYQALQADGTDLIEMLAVTLNPSVKVGQFTFALPMKYEYYGTTYSGYRLREKALHRLEMDTQVTWEPAKGIKIIAIMGLDFTTRAAPLLVEELGDLLLPYAGPAANFGGDFNLEDVFGELRIGAAFGLSSEE